MYDEFHISADHHTGELFLCGIGDIDGADILALAQYRAAVRDGHDLVKLMGDKEDGFAFFCKTAHDFHQLVDLLRCQNSRRFVEDQDLVIAVEHLQDLGTLLHAHGDILDQGIRVNMKTVLFGKSKYLFTRLFLLQEAHVCRLDAEDDVVENREALDQFEMLVYHADVQRIGIVRIADGYFDAVLFDDALFRLI